MTKTDQSKEKSEQSPVDFTESSSVFDIQATKEIFTQLKKINAALPGAHQSLLSIVENTGDKSPKPRTYARYKAIMESVNSGVTVYTTSKRLKIPYSTCHAYTRMTAEQVAKLKAADSDSEADSSSPTETQAPQSKVAHLKGHKSKKSE
ncbi:MAG: hypothetical protein LBE31_01115 [Deltaproteobacteria bacterium]|nr:hypothetical protein [Deltaproteobacteria bacterium]